MFGIIPISPNDERSRTVILMFRIFMVILVCCMLGEFFAAASLTGAINLPTRTGTQLVLVGVAIISVIRSVLYILLAVFFIMWQRRAYHNLHKAGSKYLRHSEGWAAGAWFVPFLNLAWPVQIIRDIWNETQYVFRRKDEIYQREEDNITGWWWAMFLISGFVTEIGTICLNNKSFDVGYVFAGVGSLGYLLTAFLAINMVKRISAMEKDMMERAHLYYSWVNQQEAANYQQQTGNNPGPSSQENFYKPEGPDSPPL
jgi:hypothetical protein